MVELSTNSKEAKDVEEAEVEVGLPEDTINLELRLDTSDCLVL